MMYVKRLSLRGVQVRNKLRYVQSSLVILCVAVCPLNESMPHLKNFVVPKLANFAYLKF